MPDPTLERDPHDVPSRLDLAGRLPPLLRPLVRAALGLRQIECTHAALPRGLDGIGLAAAALEHLGVGNELVGHALGAIPARGPVVFVCNHPFGALDGLIAIARLGALRPDLRVLANHELLAIPELAPLIIPVNPYQGKGAARRNAIGLRRAAQWVRDGGALLLFPAGEVARFRWRARAVGDCPWSAVAGGLVRLCGAPVVPLRIDGHNSLAFLLAGALCPPLATALLPRECFNKRGRRIALRAGAPLPAARLDDFETDADLIANLRLRSDLLSGAAPHAAAEAMAAAARLPALSPATPAGAIAAELAALPADRRLVTAGSLGVYWARAEEIPRSMHEVGRLREITFRAVGEGTGQDIDRDLFDNYYDQLLLWDEEAREIVGGYRLCRIDDVRRRFGTRGLYTHTLFEYHDSLFTLLGPTVELGRSFVRPERQRGYTPLMLLWRGIGEYLNRHPRYHSLLGPVSISADYQESSRELLVEYLRVASVDPLLSHLVRARTPYRRRHALQAVDWNALQAVGADGVSDLLTEFEQDAKGMPVLLRQYLKLGGRILGFNVDAAFANSLDCLLLVDLRRTDPKLLRRYLPAEACERIAAQSRAAGSWQDTRRGLR